MIEATDFPPIDQVLPHRYPFLLVDRIVELEPNQRIVGIKNVSAGEAHLSRDKGGLTMPPTLVMEAVAQVGAFLVLSSPEHRDKLAFFLGMDRVRHRKPARAGDTLWIEVVAQKLKGSMGRMSGTVRVDGETIASGVVTFALAARPDAKL